MARKAPERSCPNCSQMVHVRKSTCSCGHVFYKRTTPEVPVGGKIGKTAKGAPQKICPTCSNKIHVKSSKCPCGYSFYATTFKPQSLLERVDDITESIQNEASDNTDQNLEKTALKGWKQLQKDDIIKSVAGFGPFWVNKNNERVYLGTYGKFKVHKVLSDGILVTTCNVHENNSFEFIYMGEDKKSALIDNCTRSSHRLLRLKRTVKNE